MQGIAESRAKLAKSYFRFRENPNRGDRIRACDLVLPKHPHQQGYN